MYMFVYFQRCFALLNVQHRHLDSSLIDVDVHPHYISIVIKGKVLRLTLPVEVKAGEAKAQR
jgi:protein TilB